ncbi:outer membrane beta-barrel protein [Sphingobacterium spiritivorum]|uniref:outer membrane beta-barrel protein n=1 Tax=Sphingobacterium spiritivorum TaxID=258 RepID=UPI003DA6C601
MKKLLFSIIAMLLIGTTAVQAQGFKGKWFIMGEAGYSTQSDGNIQHYSVLPVVGTFVAPTTAIGLGVGYLGQKDKTVPNIVGKKEAFIVQPLARKYWGITDNFLIFGQAAVPLTFGKNSIDANGVKTDNKFTGYGVQLSPGIDYFMSSHFSIEASFGLLGWSAVKPKDGEIANDFNIGVNSGFQNGVKFGLKYIF